MSEQIKIRFLELHNTILPWSLYGILVLSRRVDPGSGFGVLVFESAKNTSLLLKIKQK